MLRISFNHFLNDIFIFPVFIASIFIIYYIYNKKIIKWHMLFFALNTLSAIIILSMIFQPELSIKTASRKRENLCLLIDTSLSMGIQEKDKGTERLEMVKKFIAEDTLFKRYNIFLYRFGNTVEKIEGINNLPELTPENNASLITDSLAKTVKMIGDDYKGILLFTDGQESRTVKIDELKESFKVPVFTIGVGENPPEDIGITEVISNSPVYNEESIRLAVYIKQSGFDNRRTVVLLKEAGKTIQEKPVTFSGETETAEFEILSPPLGERVYEVEVPPAAEEQIIKNNAMNIFVRVISPQIKILYVEGSLRWEYKFLKRLLESNTNLSPVFLIRVGDNFHLHQTGKEKMTAPANIFDPVFLKNFDVVLLGNINLSNFPAEQIKSLYHFVYSEKKSLLLLGGENFAEGLKNTPLEEIIPLSLITGSERTVLNRQFYPSVTEEGKTLSVFENGEHTFPPLDRVNNVTITKSGSIPILEVKEVHPPLILVGINTVHGGKCAFVGTDSTWKWQFGNKKGEKAYQFFWGRLIRYMWTPIDEIGVGRTVPDILVDRKFFGKNEEVHLEFAYKTGEEEGKDKKFEAFVTAPDKQKIPLPVESSEISFKAEQEGLYTVSATSRDKKNIKEIFVSNCGEEFRKTKRNELFLKYIAELSGGTYIPFENIQQLESVLKREKKFITRNIAVTKNSNKYLIPLVFIILNLGWYLRRRSGIL